MTEIGKKKLAEIRRLLDALENYTPVFTDWHEVSRLRTIKDIIKEDIQFMVEDLIRSRNGTGE